MLTEELLSPTTLKGDGLESTLGVFITTCIRLLDFTDVEFKSCESDIFSFLFWVRGWTTRLLARLDSEVLIMLLSTPSMFILNSFFPFLFVSTTETLMLDSSSFTLLYWKLSTMTMSVDSTPPGAGLFLPEPSRERKAFEVD